MSSDLPPETPEAPTQEVPPPPPSGRGRLTRTKHDRVLAGVGAGLGRYFGVDPVIIRIALVVLTFFGGAGALLYLAAVLLVPAEDEVAGGASKSPFAADDRNRGLTILGVVVLVLVAGPVLLAPALFAGGIIVPLGFLVVLGLGVAWIVTGKRPEREAGAIVRATLLGLGVLALVGALSIIAFWAAGVGGDAVVAGIVIAAGVGVLVAAFARPARWLILPALAVAVPAAFVAAAGIDLDGGIGERSYRPASATQISERYEIGIGRVEVDLRGVDLPAGDRRLDLDVGMGEAVVIVPDDVCVTTEATLGMGAVDVFDRGSGGVDLDWIDQTTAKTGQARLVLDADVGIGHLDVRKTDPRDHRDFDGDDELSDPRDWRDRDWDGDEARGENTACAA